MSSIDTVPQARDAAAQLRRRREAADRLPPLEDGRRDPIDPPVKRRPFAFVTVDEQRSLALIRGKAGIKEALNVIGVPYGWSRTGRGWVFDAAYLADLEAYVQLKHGFVVVSKRKAVAS